MFKKYKIHILNAQGIKSALKKEFCIEVGDIKTRNKMFVQVKTMRM